MRRTLVLSLLVSVFSCGGTALQPVDTPEPPSPYLYPPETSDAELPRGLTVFSGPKGCAALEANLHTRAIAEIRGYTKSALANAKYEWRCQQPNANCYSGADAGAPAGGGAGGSGGSSNGPQAYTATNTQLAAVDEPDLMKTDGTRIFTLAGSTLHIVNSWPAATMHEVSALNLGGHPRELFLEGNTLLVLSERDETSSSKDAGSYGPGFAGRSAEVIHIDVSNLALPTIKSRHAVGGRYTSARRVGNAVRVFTQAGATLPNSLSYSLTWSQISQATSEQDLERLVAEMQTANEAIIRATPWTFWVPATMRTEAGVNTSLPIDCGDLLAPRVAAPLGAVSISTFDMSDPHVYTRTVMLVDASYIFSSPKSLYLVAPTVEADATATYRYSTWLYKFDLRDPQALTFIAHGNVAGRPSGSYAFDESAGVLRVALTESSWTVTSWSSQRQSRVVTLSNVHGVLTELGRTGNIAEGESMTAVRFVGDRAYIVTYRQTDPLFVVALKDPRHPAVVGELKVPGFSTYLHPMDADHLLAVGTYVPDGSGGWSEQRQIQVSIFDVSNPAAPKQTFVEKFGNPYASSAAQWDTHAFTWLPSRNLLALPYFDYGYNSAFGAYSRVSELKVFEVTTAFGFKSKGSITVDDLLWNGCSGYDCYWNWSWYWEPGVRRAVIADDFVYAVTTGGIRVANQNLLGAPLKTVAFAPAP